MSLPCSVENLKQWTSTCIEFTIGVFGVFIGMQAENLRASALVMP